MLEPVIASLSPNWWFSVSSDFTHIWALHVLTACNIGHVKKKRRVCGVKYLWTYWGSRSCWSLPKIHFGIINTTIIEWKNMATAWKLRKMDKARWKGLLYFFD
jgi:hypothetical protein